MRGALVFVAVFAVALFVVISVTQRAANEIPTSIGDCGMVQVRGEAQRCASPKLVTVTR